MHVFRFSTAGEIICGPSVQEALTDIIRSLKAANILVVTDSNILRSGLIETVLKAVEVTGADIRLIDSILPEPPTGQIDTLQKELKDSSFDLVVAIGGGSVLDSAKLLSVLINSSLTVEKILGVNLLPGPGIPLVAIPTTAGTGSEVTPNAIVTLKEKRLKIGVVSRYLLPAYVILDPAMTIGMPPLVTASTGIDAFIHSLESVTSNKANGMCDAVGFRSMRLIHHALPLAYKQPENLEARRDMLVGSMLGGMALSSAGTTAVHALSYPLGGQFGIPHGIANAIMLIPVMEYTAAALENEFAEIALELRICPEDASPAGRAVAFMASLKELVAKVGIPMDLRAYGIGEKDLGPLAEAASQVTRLLGNSRQTLDKADIRAIYDRAFFHG